MDASAPNTVLQIQCGTCMQILSVPADLLESLLHAREYSCPKCSSRQAIHLQPQQEVQLRHQARQLLAQQAAAAAHAAQHRIHQQHHAQHIHHRPTLPPHQQLTHRLQQGFPRQMPPRAGMQRPPDLPRGSALKPPTDQQHDLNEFLGAPPPLEGPEEEEELDEGEVRETFLAYTPAKLPYGKPHPDPVVETASLASVDPPDITYKLTAHSVLVDEARLSALQLESIVYACQRHEQRLPDGARAAFFIGDGAGVGKGRTIAGLILENWMQGRKKHLWISVGSDLKFDARRDLDDAGATDIPLHPLNKLPYGKLASAKIGLYEGVVFLTYSSLISSSERGRSRFKQLIEWCGPDFDGLVVFDESHKAKNLVPEAGSRSTQVGLRVKDIQTDLPEARIVYCSATGASEPRNMGYMTRLGLWGTGHSAFRDFAAFLDAVQGKGGANAASAMATLELVAMDMKSHGMYVSRTLSYAGAEFETLEAPLEEPVASQYAVASEIWNRMYREFLAAEEAAAAAGADLAGENTNDDNNNNNNNGPTGAASGITGVSGAGGGGKKAGDGWKGGSPVWRYFWSAHQRFFRHMCMAAKVPPVVRMANAALSQGKCIVIGLQSTGEARTADVIAERGEELDDFVSGPKELLLRLVEDHYPLPPDPMDEDAEAATTSSDEDFVDRGTRSVSEAAAKGKLELREGSRRRGGQQQVRYKEYHSDEEIGMTSDEDGGKNNVNQRSESGSALGAAAANDNDNSGSDDNDDDDDDDDDHSDGSGVASDPSYDPLKRKATPSSSETSISGDEQQDADVDETKLTPQELERLQKRRDRRAKKLERRELKRRETELRQERKARALAALSEALTRRDALREVVAAIELPPNPLDDLIDRLGGPNKVAEMTGRKGRLVRDANGSGTVKYEPRNASGTGAGATLEMINVHERGLFLDGSKLVAIISEAASAGISLHADRRVANQRRRVHLTLELPWSADKAIQQFGRSHRANQAHGPQYRLIFTPLGGERRFASAVARRLESLGALTQGDRRAGPSLAAFNYESTWGQRALREMYASILEEKRPPTTLPLPCRPGPDNEPPLQQLKPYLGRLRAQLVNYGLLRPNRTVLPPIEMDKWLTEESGAPTGCGTLEDRDRADVPRFLNRLLGLSPDAQEAVFDYFQATMDELVDKARREGSLDEGILDLRAHSITLDGEPQVLHKDPVTGASCILYSIKLDRGMPFEDCAKLLEEHQEREMIQEQVGLTSPGLAAPPGLLAAVPVNETATTNSDGVEDTQAKKEEEEEVKEEKVDGAGGDNDDMVEKSGEDKEEPTANGTTKASEAEEVKEEEHAVKSEKEEEEVDLKEEEDNPPPKRRRRAKTDSTATAAAKDSNAAATATDNDDADEKKPSADNNTIPDSTDDDQKPATKPNTKGNKTKTNKKANDVDSDGAIDLTYSSDDDDDADDTKNKKKTPAKAAQPNKEQTWESGFYKTRMDGIKRVYVMLALKVPGSTPPTYTIYRPTTGRSKALMPLKDLKAKYTAFSAEDTEPEWKKAFEAGAEERDGRPAIRMKTVHILGGAVMRSWGALQRALQRLKPSERRVRVLRIATTGEEPQRLVGMLVPEPVVEKVTATLTGKDDEEKEKKKEKTVKMKVDGEEDGKAM